MIKELKITDVLQEIVEKCSYERFVKVSVNDSTKILKISVERRSIQNLPENKSSLHTLEVIVSNQERNTYYSFGPHRTPTFCQNGQILREKEQQQSTISGLLLLLVELGDQIKNNMDEKGISWTTLGEAPDRISDLIGVSQTSR